MIRTCLVLLVSVTMFCSCGSDDEVTPTFVPLGKQIIGSWKVTATTENSTKSATTYPSTIEDYIFTFGSDSRMKFDGPCNGGGAESYVYTESGTLIFNGVIVTTAVCSATENDWEGRIVNGIKNAYHGSISGNTLNILTNGNYGITLTRM